MGNDNLRRGGERLLTARQVSEWLGVSEGWIRDHASARRRPYLPAVRLGKLLRFHPADVEMFISECRRIEQSLRMAA